MSGDQHWSVYDPDSPSGSSDPAEAPTSPRPEPTQRRRSVRTPTPTPGPTHTVPGRGWAIPAIAMIGGAAGVVAVIAVVVVVVASVARSTSHPDILTPQGYGQLRAAVQKRTGGTEVFRAVIYGKYAVLDVPVDATSQREESLRWDGGFDDFGGKDTASEGRVDLAAVDPTLIPRLVADVDRLVDHPDTSYVIIEGADGPLDQSPVVRAYASNEFNELAYLETDLDGTLIRRYVSTEGSG